MAADEAVIVELPNPDDAAVERNENGVAPPYEPWTCHAQFGRELTSILFSIAVPS